MTWRNGLYDATRTTDLVAVVAFGQVAQEAVSLWDGRAGLEVVEVPHPSSHDEQELLDRWREAITTLRGLVEPDADGDTTGPNYGTAFAESDYAPIHRRDLPFGAPAFLGDDAWRRAAGGRNSVDRPTPDDRHTLRWVAPPSSQP
jgi:hypothetical protein